MKRFELTDDEIQVLANIMDAGVKHLGINCVHNASVLLRKLEQAKDVPKPEGDGE